MVDVLCAMCYVLCAMCDVLSVYGVPLMYSLPSICGTILISI